MGFAWVLAVLTVVSVNCAAWGDYVKAGTEKEDGKDKDDYPVIYYEKAFGCHKGYEPDKTGYEDGEPQYAKKCKKCKDLSKDIQVDSTEGGDPILCKDKSAWDEKEDVVSINCYCKDKKWVAGSCPAWVKNIDAHDEIDADSKKARDDRIKYLKDHKKYAAYVQKQCLFWGCMPYTAKGRCSGVALWAFIVVIVVAVVVVVAIVVVIIVIVLKVTKKPTTKVDPAPVEAKAAEPPAEQTPPEVVGPSVVIKLGKQENQTKKAADGPTAVWGEAIVFTGLGAEDDDVTIEVKGNDGEVLGKAELRIPEYVNNKKRAELTLKNGEADAGVLEVDIEIQVQEEPEVKITGVFFVDKYTKPTA